MRSSEDDVPPDTEMGDPGGCELGMCKEVSWEEVVEVLKCLRRGKAPGPDGILNEIVIYSGEVGGSSAAGDEFGAEECVLSCRLEEESAGAYP